MILLSYNRHGNILLYHALLYNNIYWGINNIYFYIYNPKGEIL